MVRPEERRTVEAPVKLDPIDLSAYDSECMKQHVMTVVIGGVEMPVWRAIEKLLWVKDQDTSELIPFRMRWGQRYLYRELLKQGLAGKPMRLNVLKARQLGFSTVIAAIFFLNAMFRPHTRWCVIADVESHASNIFGMYQTFYDNLDRSLPCFKEIQEYEHDTGKRSPLSIKPNLANVRAGHMMKTADNDSQIEVIVAGAAAGRSATYSGVHSSETGFQSDLSKTNVALFATVSIKNKNSIIIIETTANGYNEYKELWDKDASGKSQFAAVFVPWYRHPDYFLERPPIMPQMDQWIYEKRKEHPEVTDEQLMWYWAKYTEGYKEDTMKQEYPWDPNDAFISSGKSVFDMGKLKKRKDYLLSLGKYWTDGMFSSRATYSPDGTSIDMSGVEFEEDEAGYFRIFQKPRPGMLYVVICDPSKGMNYDYSAIQVISVNPVREVARFNAKDDLDSVARQIYCAGIYYNTALVSVENNTGPTILNLLVKMHYPNIYLDQNQVYDDITQTYSRRYGHMTTIATRQPMIDSFVMGFRENPEMVWDLDTLNQMETFQIVRVSSGGQTRYKATASGANAHDDLVMSFAPFWMVRSQVDTSSTIEVAEKEKTYEIRTREDFEAYRREMRRKQESRGKVRNSLGITW